MYFLPTPPTVAWVTMSRFLTEESSMKPIRTKSHRSFDDLPLFQVARHRQIWESMEQATRTEAVDLLARLFLDHLRVHQPQSERKRRDGHE
jgi:hypothetical protein